MAPPRPQGASRFLQRRSGAGPMGRSCFAGFIAGDLPSMIVLFDTDLSLHPIMDLDRDCKGLYLSDRLQEWFFVTHTNSLFHVLTIHIS